MPVHRRKYDRQQVYEFLVKWKIEHNGNSPSLLEIKEGCRISSRSVVAYILGELHNQGLIVLGGGDRNISIPRGEWKLKDG